MSPKKNKPTQCPVCGSERGCRPTHLNVKSEPLDVEDFRDIFLFMRNVYLPFMHNLVAKARLREKEKGQNNG